LTLDLPSAMRPFKSDDLPFVRDSFYKAATIAHEYNGMDPNVTKPGFRKRFERFARVSDIWIIGDAVHDEPLFGWIAVTNLPSHSIIWWIYIKNGYRGYGFAHELMAHVQHKDKIVYPFRSRISNSLAAEAGAVFNPFVYEDMCFEN
jgi:ribosomal protein S18 acetylase RimI-like enzyme